MALITTLLAPGRFINIRTQVAQATTGQTDWLQVPPWAKFAVVDFNLTATAGNTPTAQLRLQQTHLNNPLNDTTSANLQLNTASGNTTGASARIFYIMGPGVTGIANSIAHPASGTAALTWNAFLPPVLGLQLTLDRTTGDETYSYTLCAYFCK